MVWKVLRPHFWMLDRRIRKTNRFLLIGLFALLWFGGMWVYNHLIRDNLALLNSDQALEMIASFLPQGFLFLMLFALLGIGDVLHQLYLASDLELLMVAPVSSRTVYAVKLLQCSRITLIPAIGIGAVLLAFGLAREAGSGYYLLVMLIMLASMMTVTVLTMVLVILLARLFPAQKTRAWIPVMVALLMLAILFFQQPMTQWLLGRTALINILLESMLDLGQLAKLAAGFSGLAVVIYLAGYRIFYTSFHEGWDRFGEVPEQKTDRSLSSRRRFGFSRWLRPLPAPLRFFLVKEWLDMKRNPRGLLNLFQPLILIFALVLLPVIRGGKGIEAQQPLFFDILLFILVMFLGILPVGSSLFVIAEEGRRLTLLRSVPILMKEVLKGKFWATWIPMALSWLLVFIITGVFLKFPLWQTGFLVGIALWGSAGSSAMTVAVGGLNIDFAAEELKQRISLVTNYLLMGVNSLFALWTIATSIWFMARLFPDSLVMLSLRAFAGFAPIGWVLSGKQWVLFILVVGQILFWAAVKVYWERAARRMESWEEG